MKKKIFGFIKNLFNLISLCIFNLGKGIFCLNIDRVEIMGILKEFFGILCICYGF